MPELLMRQDAANRMGLHFAKLERLRLKGHIPEAVKVGRLYLFPAAQLDTIRTRLAEKGLIQPKQEANHVGA